MRTALTILSLACGALTAGPLDAASNLLQNGEFDTELPPWQFFDLSGGQLIADSRGCTNSHAVSNISTGDPEVDQDVVWIHQCVDLDDPPPSHLYARIRYDPSIDHVEGRLEFSTSDSCSTGDDFISESITVLPSDTGEWLSADFSAPVPANAGSVRFWAVFEGNPSLFFTSKFDSAELRSEDFVFLDDFEIGETCRWSVPSAP